MESIGKTLRDRRIEKGLTIEDVSDAIKIRRKYLEAIESGNYGEIPDVVYTKSFLKIYAEYLEFDRVLALKRYFDEVSQEETFTINSKNLVLARERVYLNTQKRNSFKLVAYISFLVIIALFALVLFVVLPARKSNHSSEMYASSPANESSNHVEPKENYQDSPYRADPETNVNDGTSLLPIPIDQVDIPDPEPLHQMDNLNVAFTTSRRVWVSHITDETTRESFTMSANETRHFYAEKKILFQIGNAGGLAININQFELGVIGASGEVIDLEVILSPNQSIQVNVIKDGKIIESKMLTT